MERQIDSKWVLTIDNLFDNDECDKQVDRINKRIDTGTQRTFTVHSGASTDKYDAPGYIEKLYTKISKLIDTKKLNMIEPNNFILTSKYYPGQQIGLHTDTPFITGDVYSKYKVLIYLNDNFEGGKTEFYDNCFQKQFEVTPVKGMCLIFDMGIFHAGAEVLSGEKYWIGFEILGKATG